MTICRQPRAGPDWAHVKNPCKESGARARKSQSLLVKLGLKVSQMHCHNRNQLAEPAGEAGSTWSMITGTTSTPLKGKPSMLANGR